MMKPSLDPIRTTRVDLSRSQLQSPFAVVQFLEAGFNGIPSMIDLRGWALDCSNRRLHPSTPNSGGWSCLDSRVTRQQIGNPLPTILGSPIELVLLKSQGEVEEDISPRSDERITTTQEASVPTSADKESEPAPQLMSKRRGSTFTTAAATPSLSSSLVSLFWHYLPALLVISALLLDMPPSSIFLTLPESLGYLDRSPVMLSVTLCGMLLLWLVGCMSIVLIALILYEIVSVPDGETSSKKFGTWTSTKLF